MYTAISKKRACTVKSETADKVKLINERMAVACDRSIERDRRAQDQRDRRAAYKAARKLKAEMRGDVA